MSGHIGSAGRLPPPASAVARRLAAVVLAALVTGLVLAAPASAAPARGLWGVVSQDGGPPTAGDLDTMRGGGVGSIRLLAHWSTVEAEEGVYDWTTVDGAVRAAVKHGLEPVLFLWGSPKWAANRDGYACGSACTAYAPASAQTRAAFAAFAAAAVGRYGPGGEFWHPAPENCPTPVAVPVLCPTGPPEAPCECDRPLPLRTWQVWNEQNSPTYYAPVVDVAGYAELLTESAAAIRSVDPGAEVVLGGMWGPNHGQRAVMPASLYLKRLYRVEGAREGFDSIALHPYAANLIGVRNQIRASRRVVRRARDRGTGTWITELGWASEGPADSPYVKGLEGQARMLTRAFSLLEENHRAYRLRGVFWYAWRDKAGGSTTCDWCAHAGLRDEDGSAKPAWDAFVRIAR